MAEHFGVGMLIGFAAGLLNGSFTLPMKYARAWKWEHSWSVYSILALLVFPWSLAVAFVPHLAQVYGALSWRAIVYPAFFGFLWGIAQTTFGLAVNTVGMAIAFAIVAGLVCVTGALIPILAFNPADLFRPIGLMILASIPVFLIGLALYARAGIRREQEQKDMNAQSGRGNKNFKTGLALCIFTGILGSAWNVGFAFSSPILHRSMELGASGVTSTYAAWAVVLSGSFLPNFLYPLYLLSRHGGWAAFARGHWVREWALGVAMAVLWISAIVSYGIGATFVGRYGTSIVFTIYIAATILASSLLGVITGEWRGTSRRTHRLLEAGVIAMVASVVILNFGGLFTSVR